MSSAEIARFLRARYAEARAFATAATSGPWAPERREEQWGEDFDTAIIAGGKLILTANSEYNGALNADYLAANAPQCTLADLDAKEAVLRELPLGGWHEPCASLVDLIVALMAAPFADHPDYKEAWRP